MNARAAFNIINGLLTALQGFLNVIGASKVVSDMIAARLQAGRSEWTETERAAVESALDTAKAGADAAITAAEQRGT